MAYLNRKKQKPSDIGIFQAGDLGSVGSDIERSVAGRDMLKKARHERQGSNSALFVMQQNSLQKEEEDLRRKQIPEEKIDEICKMILSGVEGIYLIFGTSLKVYSRGAPTGTSVVVELLEVLPEVSIAGFVRLGTYVSVNRLRIIPENVIWKSNPAKLLSEYLHTTQLGKVARELRREHFQSHLSQEVVSAVSPPAKPRTLTRNAEPVCSKPKPKKPTGKGDPVIRSEDRVREFSKEFLSISSVWRMPDEALLKTWSSGICGERFAEVVSLPKGHKLESYSGEPVKIRHLALQEDFSHGHELRAYLRVLLGKVS